MANRKLGKVENLVNLGKVIPGFLFAEFLILPYSQNGKLGFKNLRKKSRVSDIANFAKFAGKHLGGVFFFNQLVACSILRDYDTDVFF